MARTIPGANSNRAIPLVNTSGGVTLIPGIRRRMLDLDTGSTSGATMGTNNGRPGMMYPPTGTNYWRSNMFADLSDRIADTDITFWIAFASPFSGALDEVTVLRIGYAFDTVGEVFAADLTFLPLNIDMEGLIFDTLYEASVTIPSASIPSVIDSATFHIERLSDNGSDTFPQNFYIHNVEVRYQVLGIEAP